VKVLKLNVYRIYHIFRYKMYGLEAIDSIREEAGVEM